MSNTSIFGSEVSRLEEKLVNAERARDNAERNAKRLADLLQIEKREHASASKDLGISREEVSALERELEQARARAGKLAEAERKASDAEKKAAKLERDVKTVTEKWTKVLAERDDVRTRLAEVSAENLRLDAEIDPVRLLAAAITVWHAAGQDMVAEAKKIRGEK